MTAEVIPIAHYGATPEDWAHFQFILGLTADLLPVVSNPRAVISPDSKMKAIGKTPSRYNGRREAVGLHDWTAIVATPKQIAAWSTQRDYGICIQTRTVRAIDVDITSQDTADRIRALVDRHAALPTRRRDNSSKFLVAFELPGDFTKRILRTAHGNIEFLATGQQFIACGTHPSGTRYEWQGGLPDDIPELTPDQFETLWTALEAEFAVEPGTTTKASTKAQQLTEAANADPVAQHLIRNGWVKSRERDGRLHVRCPWEAEHTTESADSATSYFPAHTGGYQQGHFHCMHAHCAGRSDEEFLHAVGLSEFEAILEAALSTEGLKYPAVWAKEFSEGEPPGWIVDDILPQASLAVVYGASGSGKTFAVLDMVAAVARGTPWREHAVQQGNVLYVCAEGVGGFKKRLKAYRLHNQVDDLRLAVLQGAPNIMEEKECAEIIKTVRAIGGASVIVVDTLAHTLQGNENAAEDMSAYVNGCRVVHEDTGALVIVIHHSGKDASKGARGSTALRAAADAEFEVIHLDDDFGGERALTITKMKDGEDGVTLGFRLFTVEVGEDRKGKSVASCCVEAMVEQPKGKRGERKKKLGDKQIIVLKVIQDALDLDGEVRETEVIRLASSQLSYDAEGGGRDLRRQQVMQALESLKASGRVTKNDKGMLTVSGGQ